MQHFFKTLQERGDIYQGRYEGWYCLPDETYFSDDEIQEGRVPAAAAAPVERVSEVNYFFALSRYGKRLKERIASHPDSYSRSSAATRSCSSSTPGCATSASRAPAERSTGASRSPATRRRSSMSGSTR